MEKEKTSTEQRKVEKLHWEIQQWKLQLQFIDNENLFISRLLDSNIFKPNILNLFERLQDYKHRLKKLSDAEEKLRHEISKHESNLGSILERTDNVSSLDYYINHDKLQSKVATYIEDFQKLKSEIFNYVGGLLKKH
jgi:hypothetical protein